MDILLTVLLAVQILSALVMTALILIQYLSQQSRHTILQLQENQQR